MGIPMALLADQLTVWEIAFRWANRDPFRPWPFLPLEVKDHFRNLMDAIHQAELFCCTITLEKRSFQPVDRIFSIYHWLDDIGQCRGGLAFNRKMFRHALIERRDLMLWCERRKIPIPEFWFPPGWNLEYDLPDGEIRPGHFFQRSHWTDEDWAAWDDEQAKQNTLPACELSLDASMHEAAVEKQRPSQEAKIACQQIAKALWKDSPDRRITSIAKDELVQKYGGGSFYVFETVRDWVAAVAPPEVKARRGRPRKNEDEDE